MELHASAAQDFHVCKRLYYYRHVERLRPRNPSEKLVLGSGVHKALDAYYRGLDPRTVYDAWADEELRRIRDLGASVTSMDKIEEEVALGAKLVTAYVEWAKRNDMFEIVHHPEQEFRVPIYITGKGRYQRQTKGRNAWHVGRYDMLVREPDGRLWVMDHKTARDWPDEETLVLHEQLGYYVLAAHYLFPGERIAGAIYNCIRKVDPDRAKTEVVRRYKVLFNRHALLRLRERIYRTYREIVRETFFEPTPGQHCAWRCPYRELCLAQEDGTDVEALIEANFVREKDKAEEVV